jgi:outer membrane protein insertion porin family/translocation and assembly module TamA
LLVLAVTGCARIPQGRAAVDTVEISGTRTLSSSELQDKIATSSSPKFLGLFRGVIVDYEIFERHVLQRDLQRIEQYYRDRGFYEARVRAARIVYLDEKHVQVMIEVHEGEPVLLKRAQVFGLENLPQVDALAAERAMQRHIRPGKRFDAKDFENAEAAMRRALTDRGYAFATTERRAEVDLPGRYAVAFFEVDPDRKATLGPIRVVGLGPLPEAPVRRAMNLKEGQPYSTAELDSARQSILDLGVFASVDIEPEPQQPLPEPRVVPLLVRVQPTRLSSVQLGGGFELDVIRTDVHLQLGWETRNFLGGMRGLQAQVKPGLVLYPTRLPTMPAPERLLPEVRSRVEFRQPGFLEARTTGFSRAEFNVFPVLLAPQVDPTFPVIGYREIRFTGGVDRTLWRRLYANLSHSIQRNSPFTYVGELDRSLSSVTISYVALLTQFDFRDNRVHPRKGFLIGNELQVAGGIFGGQARDVRVQPEARFFLPLARKVTLATRASVGFLFPGNYANTLDDNERGDRPDTDEARRDWVRDAQITYFRAFFSGGSSSNRGYPLRGVGPHGTIPFFNPTLAAQQLANQCTEGNPDYSARRCSLPLGGLSLWEASVELRFPIYGALTGAAFCDASDVSAARVNLRFNYPHLSCGPGVRYDTPVGPVRLDIGYRIPGLQAPASDPQGGDPGSIFGAPLAIALGIGQAF